ncbi:hypothetical protein Agub_g5958, partial [Astrephomene gubernaculifera]
TCPGPPSPPPHFKALRLLHVSRLDHAVRASEDPALLAWLAASRTPVTLCPLSNHKLKVCEGQLVERYRQLLRSGLMLTVNSDDAAYFGGYINDNYEWFAAALGLGVRDIAQLAANSFEASFALPGGEVRRRQLVARVW